MITYDEEMTNNNERIEDLECGGLKIIQDKSLYTFTSDSVTLANFVKIKSKEKALEIGAGGGVISILLTAKTRVKKIVAFEMQEQMAVFAERNVTLNKLDDRIEIINDKIQNYNQHFKDGEFDVVFSTPPYMLSEPAQEDSVRYLSRHDKMLKIDELCELTSKALKFGGRAYFVYASERSAELIYHLVRNRLEPKALFFTENGKGKTVLVVVEAVKGGKHGVKVLPNLVTNGENGDYLEKLHTRNFIK